MFGVRVLGFGVLRGMGMGSGGLGPSINGKKRKAVEN